MKTQHGQVPRTLRHLLFGASLGLAATQYIEAFAQTMISEEVGWQQQSQNLIFTTSGTVSIGDNARGDDNEGKLVIGTSTNVMPSLLLHYTSGTSTTKMRIKAAPGGSGWDLETIDNVSDNPVPRLRIGSNGVAVEILGGANGSVTYSKFSTGAAELLGTVSATSVTGDGSGLTDIPFAAIKNPGEAHYTSENAKFAETALGLTTPRVIKLSGAVQASESFDGTKDIAFETRFNESITPSFTTLNARSVNGTDGEFTNQLKADSLWLTQDISATAPALAFTALNSQAGIFLNTNGALGIGTSGTGHVWITANGAVGVGTDSPTATLHVSGTALFSGTLQAETISASSGIFSGMIRAGSFNLSGTANHTIGLGIYRTASGEVAFATGSNQAMVINANGNVGIATTDPSQKLEVRGDARASGALSAAYFRGSGTGLTNIPGKIFGTFPPNYFALSGARSHFIKYIGSTGDFGFIPLPVSQSVLRSDGWKETKLLLGRDFKSLSDIRFKTNIRPIQNPLDTILKINGLSYSWNRRDFPERAFPDRRQTGFIAQEVERILPEMVTTGEDGFKKLDYLGFIAIHLEAIKSLNRNYNDQDSKLKSIEAKIKITEEWIEKSELRFKSIESVLSPNAKMPETGIFLPAASTLGFATRSGSRVIIDPNGSLGIGTQTPSAKLDVRGDALISRHLFQLDSGYVLADNELKSDLKPIDDALIKIGSLNGIVLKQNKKQPTLGISAHEIRRAFPEIVRSAPTSTPDVAKLAVNYNGLVAPLVESVKSLKSNNQKLQEKNTRLLKIITEQAASDENKITELQRSLSEQDELLNRIAPQQQSRILTPAYQGRTHSQNTHQNRPDKQR